MDHFNRPYYHTTCLRWRRQHNETMEHTNWKMLENVGVPDCH